MIDPAPFIAFNDFAASARGVLALLQERIRMSAWVVTRVQGDQLVVLNSQLPGAGDQIDARAGMSFPFQDTVCHQMVAGLGPTIAPDIDSVPAYRECSVARQLNVKGYIGVPLLKDDGAVFGTLCGVSLSPLPETVAKEKALIEMLARLLSTLLGQQMRADEAAREAERSQAEAMRDALTGLYNRRAMGKLMETEENRCRRYGHPASVLVIDLNGLKATNDRLGHSAGDTFIRLAAGAIQAAARDADVVARVGGDEFAILAVECDAAGGEALAGRVRAKLAEAGIGAGIGVASRDPTRTIFETMDLADERMYADKRRIKAEQTGAANELISV